eukprot:15441723-Alexandrium_andersonii.AAC.1
MSQEAATRSVGQKALATLSHANARAIGVESARPGTKLRKSHCWGGGGPQRRKPERGRLVRAWPGGLAEGSRPGAGVASFAGGEAGSSPSQGSSHLPW